jgi:Fe-S oxidoreductase
MFLRSVDMEKEEKITLDVTEIENFRYDMSRCVRCKGCKWVDHIYMPGVRFATRCPSEKRYLFDSYSAYGRLKLALAVMDGKLDFSDKMLDAIYKCALCGACDAGCKRNLDLEILLSHEALRVKAVESGKGPMPEHKQIAHNIEKNHNRSGAPHINRSQWLLGDTQRVNKADMVYFAGCGASYVHPEIAQATARILIAAKSDFMVLGGEEWCCGYPLYSTGQVKAAKVNAEHMMEVVRKSGANTVLVSCAECYKTFKVDYPKMFNKSTTDMGFRVVHLAEYVDELMKKGILKFTKKIDLRVTYHDPCNLARLSEPWIYWEGTRGHWGVTDPPMPRRRGTNGIYQQPRDILKSIPGIELVEMVRFKENAWCCGAGGGVKEAFPDFALWVAGERLEEVNEVGAEAIVSCCPWCKDNFNEAIKKEKWNVKVYDISELIGQAISL